MGFSHSFPAAATFIACCDIDELNRLVPLAAAEGFGHLERLVSELVGGTNRVEKVGETLLIAQLGGETIGCGGLTRQRETVGRVRRVYVDPKFRRMGLGRELVETLIENACRNFESLVLFTDNSSAARLYERLGFVPEEPKATSDFATHRLNLRSPG